MEAPEPVWAIVIEPEPLLIEIPEPGVRADRVKPSVELLPIKSWPSVIEVPVIFCPVPPFARGRIPVTSAVKETAEDVSLPVESECIRPVEYPEKTIPLLAAFLPDRVMSPVVLPPNVRVWALVVPRFPAPVRKAALSAVPAEIEAVGVRLPVILSTANLAEEVVVPPKSRSRVEMLGVRKPRESD